MNQNYFTASFQNVCADIKSECDEEREETRVFNESSEGCLLEETQNEDFFKDIQKES